MSQSLIWKNGSTTTVDDPMMMRRESGTMIMPDSTMLENQHHNILNNDSSPVHPEKIGTSLRSSFTMTTSASNLIYHHDNNNSFSHHNDSDIRAMSFSPTSSSLQSLSIINSVSTSPTTTVSSQPQQQQFAAGVPGTNDAIPRNPDHGPVGCYLVYESSSTGRLMLHYSLGPIPENTVGFWCPAPNKPIQGFKFKQSLGRSELIKGIAGGDANRRKYFVGWCQFCKVAKSYHGKIIQFIPTGQGVAVDIYGYNKNENQPNLLNLDILTDISMYDAVAVMPKHHEFLKGVKSIGMTQFLELGNLAGATTILN